MKSFFALTGSGLCFTLSSQEGVNTVPGAIALHLIFCFTKSEAIDFVNPIIAALLAPYTNLFGSPLILDATEATLIILPPLLLMLLLLRLVLRDFQTDLYMEQVKQLLLD